MLGTGPGSDRVEMKRTLRVPVVGVWLATAVAVVALFGASTAQASKGVVGYFGNSTASGSSLAGEFATIQGMAVNETGAGPADPGDVYVADQGNNRIQRLSSTGQFELMWGRNVIRSGADVNTDLGDVFERCTFAFDCQAGALGSLGGEFVVPRAVAVDQLTGNVYVVERNNSGGARVQAFTGDGEFLWAIGKDAVTNGSPSDPGGVRPGWRVRSGRHEHVDQRRQRDRRQPDRQRNHRRGQCLGHRSRKQEGAGVHLYWPVRAGVWLGHDRRWQRQRPDECRDLPDLRGRG